MIELEFKGKTVEEAISKGLTHLGCKREDVTVKVVTEGSTGLFGQMGTKPAVVLISVEDKKRINKYVQ
jgi:spoIIIJ-associated protein